MNTFAAHSLPSASFLLDTLHAKLAIWKAGQVPSHTNSGLPTGFAELDTALRQNGWPQGALTELLMDGTGIGELSLLLPVLAPLTATQGVLLIAPPFVPYAPALAQAGVNLERLLVLPPSPSREGLAAAEQALRSGTCGAALIWEDGLSGLPAQGLPYLTLKRLHLAAERGNAMAVLYRAQRHARQPSPAALRIRLTQSDQRLQLHLFKQHGTLGEQSVSLMPWPLPVQQHIAHRPSVPAWYAIPSARLARPHVGAY
jgi:protein ImuA